MLFAGLADTSVSGLSDFQMISLCKYLDKAGVKYLNLGGSETDSLNSYKFKYSPVRSLDVLSADVVYAKKNA